MRKRFYVWIHHYVSLRHYAWLNHYIRLRPPPLWLRHYVWPNHHFRLRDIGLSHIYDLGHAQLAYCRPHLACKLHPLQS